jgi:hypothetical protein
MKYNLFSVIRWPVRIAFACALVGLQVAKAETPSMDAEIDYLIQAVAGSQCTFVRNGKEHDAEDASQHLQMKRKRGKRYYDSTEQFIERIASKSSWTDKDYLIKCGPDRTETARQWFTTKLAQFRQTAGTAGNGS